ncbi:multidrug resistance protein homolog 49 isoform X1 [Diachasma alloeum]|uniref:multidrug resistance protein homolog 49 isoform X1 n=1 Tax=Diachasma alloeum TaxID=454923 RepID=UPI00073833CE|nr:multidrug resistance protein homolog 49 isoform X1 [Diachasma alloeum]XP_015115151.1 multidrug resistance protein homolog 49 isoform X1 [Diachasma alloeum]XP_015115152.1 multidrug resistance protein homolog 49 isoform X1 [Diachasma alloeum]XP_015115153.1 multidrug resistance protein homolog 49 isoform X1 [Diachasma alloeum]XP_015115154.1 multidrug resistance protein homolog 49 isoform X1 [Diachasma alloeum]XP_015115155.1 multidrug resistance protein homolog 49 isoform X1 [Diachasma alloeum]
MTQRIYQWSTSPREAVPQGIQMEPPRINSNHRGKILSRYTQQDKEKAEWEADYMLKDNEEPIEFVPPQTKEEEKPAPTPSLPPVPYYKLFRFATLSELMYVLAGLFMGTLTGLCIPISTIQYGEFTTLLVDRNTANQTSTPTLIMAWFGGGAVLGPNATEEERMDALYDDSVAFGVSCAALSTLQFFFAIFTVDFLNVAAFRQIARVRRMFLKAVLRQDMSWYDTNTSTNFASRITEDLDKMKEGIAEKLGIFTYLMVSFISSIIISFIYGWKLTLVVLSCAPIIVIATAIVAKVQSSLTARELSAYGQAGSVAEEVLGAIRTVVAFGGEKVEVARYTKKLEPAESTGIKRGLWSGVGGGVMWFIIYMSYALAFWYGVQLILEDKPKEDKEYTPAVLVIVFFGVLAGAQNMGLTSPHLEAFAVARGSAAAVFQVLDRVPTIDSLSSEGLKLKSVNGDIEFKDVHFRYPARKDVKVLQGLNLKIKHGETVALVGGSGCGKSTCLQLIQRLYDPLQGQVLLDGIEIPKLNVAWMRSHIGLVGQEPVLFDTTIRENIRYGNDNVTEEEMIKAAKEANAHDFISKLPEGYDSPVGERGSQLSGGQKQRIAIARALVRRPAILLLDEATSALDLHSEATVQRALDAASKGRTTVIVTHRLSTITNADRIVFIKDGQVAEMGTHEELLALGNHYHALVSADASATARAKATASAAKTVTATKPKPKPPLKKQFSTLSMHSHRLSLAGGSTTSEEELEEHEKPYDAPTMRIFGLNKPEWPYNVIGCLAAAVVGASFPAFAVLFGKVYEVLGLPDDDEIRAETVNFSILFIVVGIITGVGTFLQMYMFGLAGVRMTTRLRSITFAAMLKQEMGWFDEDTNSVGALCARLSSDASAVQGATGSRIGSILQAMSTLVLGVGLSLYFTWKMTLVSIVTIPLVLGAVFMEARIMGGQGMEEKKKMECATRIAIEAISNIRTVASLGKEGAFLDRYCVEMAKVAAATRTRNRLRGLVFSCGQTIPYFGYALSLYYGGYLVAREGLPYKDVITVSEALIFGSWMLGQALAFAPNFNTAKISAGRIFRLLDRVPEIMTPPELDNRDKDWKADGLIQFSKVEFHYPTRVESQILRGLNLIVKPGQMVALVGQSGCGKSTCIQLLQRLYDPVSGTVTMDRRDISSVSLSALRAQLGVVGQEPVLFDRTIAENIAYGDNNRIVGMEEIIEAAKKSNIHSFVSSLPLGYDTRLGSKGTQLSGGQKQRIAIARALVRNPRILLLDEATSALDTQSEKVVQAALDKAMEGRTCITIAHRLATIRNADVICVFEKGTVAEMGTHDDLIAADGLYAHLHALQEAAME